MKIIVSNLKWSSLITKKKNLKLTTNEEKMVRLTPNLEFLVVIEQESQTHGPRAACGPPDVFARPATSLK
jgi:hypothetical protein